MHWREGCAPMLQRNFWGGPASASVALVRWYIRRLRITLVSDRTVWPGQDTGVIVFPPGGTNRGKA